MTCCWDLLILVKSLMYNVEFLGAGERAWISGKNVMPFEGLKKFEEFKKYKVNFRRRLVPHYT